ncbi:MAG TPA: TlpA disulfide reductase family protein [Gemmatimonadota bacterium]|nr:TlpA disulfide reductase family protein [Gemmatimonadota bacterium]
MDRARRALASPGGGGLAGELALRIARLLIAPVLLASFGIASLACGEASPGTGAVGAPAPAYAARTLTGDSVALADLEGDVVLLNVWATWCAPCREEIPALQSLHVARAADGLRIVGVSVDARGAVDDVRRFAGEFGITYELWHDPAEGVATAFLLHGVPSTVLIDREGIVRWRHVGPIREDDPGLMAALSAAL